MDDRNEMDDRGDPQDSAEWHSIGREAALVRHLLGAGVTGLGKANYADKTGEYYIAFFGLSIGLERLAKLTLVADYAITENGKMPDEQYLEELRKKFGHKLVDLLNAVDVLSKKWDLKLDYGRPTTEISAAIINCLDAFADARRGRYANFTTLGDPDFGEQEPIRKWWNDVAERILTEHYYGKSAQKRIENNAKIVDALISPFTFVSYTNEKGDAMNDVLSASTLTGQIEIVQRYGRFYALTVVRWLSNVFSQLSKVAYYDHHIDAFFGIWEYLDTYRVDDSFLKTRKIWPLR